MRKNCGKRVISGIMITCLLICFFFFGDSGMVHAETNTQTREALSSDIAQFPESYQASLLALKKIHPNWSFQRVDVMDWNTAVQCEMSNNRSLIYYTFPECVKEGAYDQGNWYFASKAVLQHFMDPRNSLTEETIFQFEQLDFNGDYQTEAAMELFLAGSFMGAGKLVPNTVLTFPFMLYACGKHETVRVNPFHLAARILQEQGAGKSALISGTYPGYEGYYNYFNIGATGTTNADVIRNGLEYAKKYWGKDLEINGVIDHNQGAYNAIFVGSQIIADDYVRKGQDTLYLQKFDVKSSTPCSHQYMQNITAPTTEASSIKKQYFNAGVLNSGFVFLIPVYQNMPEQACPMPTSSTNIVLEVPYNKNDSYNYTENYVTVDGVQYEAESYYNSKNKTRRLIVTLPNGNAKHAWIEVKDTSGDVVRGYYWDLTYYGTYYRATEGTKPEPQYCTITFEAGGGSGDMPSVQVEQGSKYQLPECNFQPEEGYEFTAWDAGKPGDEITVTQDLTITACWEKILCEIKVDRLPLEGGTIEGLTNDALQVAFGEEVRLKAIPNPEYYFDCWMEGDQKVSEAAEYVFQAEGDRELTAKFEWFGDAAVIRTALASFEGKIGLCFYLSLPESVTSDENAYLLFTINGKEEKRLIRDVTPQERDGCLQYRFNYYLVAKEYRDDLNLKVFDGQGNLVTLCGGGGKDYTETGLTYSLKRYVDVIKNYSEEKTRALALALEDYCTAAQIMFNYNAEGLAVSDAVKAIGEEELQGYAAVFEGQLPEGVTGKALTVSFEADNSVKLFFYFDEGVDPDSYQYAIDGKEAKLIKENGQYYLKTSNIAAKNLADTNTYSISDGTDTCLITCSALTYARAAYLLYGDDVKDLSRALLLYYQAAKNYFTK